MPELDPSVQRHIDSLRIRHEVIACDPDLADTEAFCRNYNIPPQNAANTILIASKTEPKTYAACLVLATTRLDVNHAVSGLMGIKRLSFATAEEAKATTGQLIGGVTVFGLPDSMPIYIDRAVLAAEYVIVGGGNRSTKIKLSPNELQKLPNARIETIAAPRPS